MEIHHGSDAWLVYNGSFKNMTRCKNYLTNLVQKYSPHKVKLDDDYQYPIKGAREASYKLDSKKIMKMKDVFYVPGYLV